VLIDFPPAPTLSVSGVSPLGTIAEPGPVEITITGSGFVNGAAAELRTPDRRRVRPVTNIQYLDANTLKGTFDTAGLRTGEWDLIVFNPDLEAASFRTGVFLPGDYNRDGNIGAADYVVWRDTLGESGAGLAADGDSSGAVDDGDYTVWRTNFGRNTVSASAAPVSVPEPASIFIVIVSMLLAGARRNGVRMNRNCNLHVRCAAAVR
jgi:hypothetical protein